MTDIEKEAIMELQVPRVHIVREVIRGVSNTSAGKGWDNYKGRTVMNCRTDCTARGKAGSTFRIYDMLQVDSDNIILVQPAVSHIPAEHTMKSEHSRT